MAINVKQKLSIKGKLTMGGGSGETPPVGDIFGIINPLTPEDPAPFNLTSPTADSGSTPTALILGTKSANTLDSENNRHVYSITLTAGTLYSFNVDSEETGYSSSPYFLTNSEMYIYGPAGGEYLLFNEASGAYPSGDEKSPFATYLPPATGTYYIGIKTANEYGSGSGETGNYDLVVRDTIDTGEAEPFADFDLVTPTPTPLPLVGWLGEYTSGDIVSAGDRMVYAIDCVAGGNGYEYVLGLDDDISLTGEAQIWLYGPLGGASLGFADNSYNSVITFDAEYTGTYYACVMLENDNQTGTYGIKFYPNNPVDPANAWGDTYWENWSHSVAPRPYSWTDPQWEHTAAAGATAFGLVPATSGPNVGWQVGFRPVDMVITMNSGADTGGSLASQNIIVSNTASLNVPPLGSEIIGQQSFVFDSWNQSKTVTVSLNFAIVGLNMAQIYIQSSLDNTAPIITKIIYNL